MTETKNGTDTRQHLLDLAETAVLQKGFGATSIEELITAAGITKNGFFYHFPNKNALARALLERYLDREDAIMDEVFDEGAARSDDPLEAFLIGLDLLAGKMADLPEGHPGCLVATYCYQERLFDRDVHELNREIVLRWRDRFHRLLAAIRARHAPLTPVELDTLADTVSTVIEGGLVLGRATKDPRILPAQIRQFRDFIAALFGRADRAA